VPIVEPIRQVRGSLNRPPEVRSQKSEVKSQKSEIGTLISDSAEKPLDNSMGRGDWRRLSIFPRSKGERGLLGVAFDPDFVTTSG